MMLRTFTAPDMPAAMKMMRDAMGDNAIILATEASKGKKGISVTAAVEKEDEQAPAPARKSAPTAESNAALEQLRFDIQNVLRFHNVPELYVSKMLKSTPEREFSSMVQLQKISAAGDEKQLLSVAMEKFTGGYFSFVPLPFDEGHLRIMLIGPPGIGKTLTIAKIAARLCLNKSDEEPNLTVITTDNKRAGGVEQLQAFTTILGLPLLVVESAKELAKTIQSLPPTMQILVDTAGCNPFDSGELTELKALSSTKGIEPVLVLPAGGDSLEAIDMVENFMEMPIKRILITRADTARRFGGIISAAAAHGLSLSNLSGSSSIVDPLQPMDGALLAQLLLRYQLQSR